MDGKQQVVMENYPELVQIEPICAILKLLQKFLTLPGQIPELVPEKVDKHDLSIEFRSKAANMLTWTCETSNSEILPGRSVFSSRLRW